PWGVARQCVGRVSGGGGAPSERKSGGGGTENREGHPPLLPNSAKLTRSARLPTWSQSTTLTAMWGLFLLPRPILSKSRRKKRSRISCIFQRRCCCRKWQ